MREEMRMVTRKRTGMRTSNLRRAYFTKTDVLSFTNSGLFDRRGKKPAPVGNPHS
jgi:hypothetical protein